MSSEIVVLRVRNKSQLSANNYSRSPLAFKVKCAGQNLMLNCCRGTTDKWSSCSAGGTSVCWVNTGLVSVTQRVSVCEPVNQ